MRYPEVLKDELATQLCSKQAVFLPNVNVAYMHLQNRIF